MPSKIGALGVTWMILVYFPPGIQRNKVTPETFAPCVVVVALFGARLVRTLFCLYRSAGSLASVFLLCQQAGWALYVAQPFDQTMRAPHAQGLEAPKRFARFLNDVGIVVVLCAKPQQVQNEAQALWAVSAAAILVVVVAEFSIGVALALRPAI